VGSVVRVISWESLVKSNLALLAESFVRREMASCTVFDCYLIPCKLGELSLLLVLHIYSLLSL